MLSDRTYMRSDYPRPASSALLWIICAIVAGSVLQFAFERWFRTGAFTSLLALSPYGLSEWRIWTLVTYALLHGGLLHLALNCLGVFLLGREIEPLLGARRFILFFAGAAALGGLAWLAVHAFSSGPMLVGASACVAAIFILFACIYPEREITFLLFFVLPVTLKPKYLAWGLLAFDGLGLLFSELPGGGFDTGIAHSAHLGGILAGWLYYRFVFANRGYDRAPDFPSLRLPRWMRRKPADASTPEPDTPSRPSAPSRRELRAEVDRILDKINSKGFGALTEDEKRLLDEAKDLLSRH
jgi:membrane associated rhomboid family serine protease